MFQPHTREGTAKTQAGVSNETGVPATLEARGVTFQPNRNSLRDHAILTLLARLGLRAGEAVGLELDGIDWRQGVIKILGKGADETPCL